MRKYYALVAGENHVDIYIYGDIYSYPWEEYGEVSAYNIVQEIEELTAGTISVYINSYGGEVAEGLAIFNALKRHPAKVTTYCDGFACSAASVVFMAGDERVMGEASLLMIHNAWTSVSGSAEELRKEADDLEKISDVAANAYSAASGVDVDTLRDLLAAESWISPAEALEWGFATSVVSIKKLPVASMNARKTVFAKMLSQKALPAEEKTYQAEAKEEDKEPEAPSAPEKKFFNFGGQK